MSMPTLSTPPVAPVMAARSASAASAAVDAARQPIVKLTASTIVKASTHSTAAVRNAGIMTVQSSMAALAVDMIAIGTLRRGDQLHEVCAAVPNRFIGKRCGRQHNAARVNASRIEQCDVVPQSAVMDLALDRAIDQSNLAIDPEHTRQRTRKVRRDGQNTRAGPTSAQQQMEGDRTAIAKADQHQPCAVDAMRMQLTVKQSLKSLRSDIKGARLIIRLGRYVAGGST